MQALHFGHSVGGIVSPLVTAPFLVPEIQPITDQNTSHAISLSYEPIADQDISSVTFRSNQSSHLSNFTTEHTFHSSRHKRHGSRLYIPYSITASLAFVCAIPVLSIFLQLKLKKTHCGLAEEKQPDENKNKVKHRHFKGPKRTKIMIILLLLSIFTTYSCVEDSFASFLSIFCVRQFHWSKVAAAQITSAFWVALAVGRLTGIGLVALLSPVTLLLLHATLLIISFILILVAALNSFYLGIWILSSALGFAMSVIFPGLYVLTETRFLPVTGRLASLFTVGACLTGAINPIILGELMDHFTDMWFIYLLAGESLLFFIILILAVYISKTTVKYSNEIVIEVKEEIASEHEC